MVHGDIKPANVLVQKRTTANAFYTTKLIDFDDSYISGQPPERGVIVGDSLFGAPEWRRYLQGDRDVKPEYLTTNTDVFALGLMSHYYLTGAIPGYSASFGSPADAVNAGAVLRLDDRLTSDMQKLVLAMTSRAPGARPKIAAFLEALVNPEICALHRKTRAPGRTPKGKANGRSGTAAETTPTSRLRTNLGSVPTASHRTTASAHPATADERAAPSAPGSVSDDTAASEPIFGSAARRKSRVHINLDGYPT